MHLVEVSPGYLVPDLYVSAERLLRQAAEAIQEAKNHVTDGVTRDKLDAMERQVHRHAWSLACDL